MTYCAKNACVYRYINMIIYNINMKFQAFKQSDDEYYQIFCMFT